MLTKISSISKKNILLFSLHFYIFLTAVFVSASFLLQVFSQVNITDYKIETTIQKINETTYNTEQKNLDELIKPKENDLKTVIEYRPVSELDTYSDTFTRLPAIILNDKSELEIILNQTNLSQKTLIISPASNILARDLTEPEIQSITNSILEISRKNNTEKFQFSYQFINIKNIHKLVERIKSQNSKIKIFIELPLIWSSTISYKSYFSNYGISNSINYEYINSTFDQIVLKAWFYTTQRSSLAGPISPLDKIINSLQFIIYKGINPGKINVEINGFGYKWSERYIEGDFTKNIISNRAEIMDVVSYEDIIKYEIKERNTIWSESIIYLQENGFENIIIFNTKDDIESKIQEIKKYGINKFTIMSDYSEFEF